MQKNIIFAILILVCGACSQKKNRPESLQDIYMLCEDEPELATTKIDSAARVFAADTNSYEYRLCELIRIRALDKAYIPINNEHNIKTLVSYFMENGSTEDKIDALYLQGGYYRDRNDFPKAIKSYLQAEELYKENDSIGNKDVIACTYAQLAGIHVNLTQLDKTLEYAKEEYSIYDEIGEFDFGKELEMGRAYQLAGKADSADIYYKRAFQKLPVASLKMLDVGGIAEIMGFYMGRSNRQIADSCMKLLNRFEPLQLPPNAWKCKAEYHEKYGDTDSAEYYLRYYNEHPRTLVDYKGTASMLFYFYKKKGDLKEAVKYAEIYDHACDSITLLNNRQASINADNFFKYERNIQEEAQLRESSLRAKMWGWAALAITLSIVILTNIVVKRYKERIKRIEQEKEDLEDKVSKFERQWLEAINQMNGKAYSVEEVREKFKEARSKPKVESVIIWQELYKSVNKEYPTFSKAIEEYQDKMPAECYKVAYLLRAGLSQADIADIRKYSRTTALRYKRRLYSMFSENEAFDFLR